MDDFKRTVLAWGYGDSMAKALQGVATLFGAEEGAFFGVAKVAVLLGFIATLLAYFSARAMADPLRIVKFYVVFIGVVSLFFGFRVPVQVQDEALNRTYVVQNVPYPVAYVLSFITQVEDAIAKQVDRAFGIGGHYCGSQKMGIFACSQIMAQAMDMRVVDPYLYLNLTNFFQDCVFTNILDGTLDAHKLETSDNLYLLIFDPSYLHPARFTVLYDGRRQCIYPCNEPCGGGCSMSCVDAAAYLRNALSGWVNSYGLKAISATVGRTVLMELLNMVPTQIMHLSQMGTGFLMQAVLINQFKETYRSWAASYGMGLTEQGIFTKGQIEKATANRYLPLINGIMHVLFASLVPLLVVFMLTPLMKGALMFTFIFGLWMITWKFTEAVVNGFFYSKLEGNFLNFASASQGAWDLNVLNAPVISTLLVDHISLGGSLYWLVPTVSFVVASLGGYAFHSFATGLGGVVQSTAQASAGDVAKGNFNAGQVNYRNVSAGNTSFGSFVFGATSAFTSSVLQESYRNIVKQGARIEGKGLSVKSALMKAFMHGDDYTKHIIAEMAKIAGLDASADILINPQGRLEYAAFYSGIDGFKVIYDGSGNLKVISQGVEHGNIKLNNEGKIDGPGRLTSVGDIRLSAKDAMKKEVDKKVQMYRQLEEGVKNLSSINDYTKRFQAFRDLLEKIFEQDFQTFLEVMKEIDKGKVFESAIKEIISKKLMDSYKTSDSKEIKGGFKSGAPWEIVKIVPGPEGSYHVIYKDENQREYSISLTGEEIKSAMDKYYEGLKRRDVERGGTKTSKRDTQGYEKRVEAGEIFESKKLAEIAKILSKRAEEALTFANSIDAEMVDNPLNDFYQQKYEEGLRLYKGDAAQAIRYAHEQTKKLISDNNALRSYFSQYVNNLGLKNIWYIENNLNAAEKDIPKEKEISEERKRIEEEVGRQKREAEKEIEKRKSSIQNFQVPEVNPPRIERPQHDFSFYKNGNVPRRYKDLQQWLNNQKKQNLPAEGRALRAGLRTLAHGTLNSTPQWIVLKRSYDLVNRVRGTNQPIENVVDQAIDQTVWVLFRGSQKGDGPSRPTEGKK